MPASPYIRALRAQIGSRLICHPSVSAAIFDDAGRLLLGHDAGLKTWITIGGMIDPLESPTEAVIREAREECGLEVRPLRVFGVFGGPAARIVYPNGDEVAFTAIGFRVEVVGGALRADDDELDRLGWFTEAEAAALKTSPLIREIVAAAFRDHAAGGGAGAYFPKA